MHRTPRKRSGFILCVTGAASVILSVELPEEVVRLSRLLRSQDATSCGSVRPSHPGMLGQARSGSAGKCGKLRLGCNGGAPQAEVVASGRQGDGTEGLRNCPGGCRDGLWRTLEGCGLRLTLVRERRYLCQAHQDGWLRIRPPARARCDMLSLPGGRRTRIEALPALAILGITRRVGSYTRGQGHGQ